MLKKGYFTILAELLKNARRVRFYSVFLITMIIKGLIIRTKQLSFLFRDSFLFFTAIFFLAI